MKKNVLLSALSVAIIIIALSCKKHELDPPAPKGHPLLPEKVSDYPKSQNDHAAFLGRVLFYDKNMSHNNSVACASCHQQSKAFCDNKQFSVGLEDKKTPRNSPSIFSRSGRMFWDGRAGNMEELSLMPVKNHVEMKVKNLGVLAQRLSETDYYPELFKRAFGSSKIDSVRMQQALGEFLRNFNFSNNKFNRSLKNQASLSASEQLGKDLFFGKARCSNCHTADGMPRRGAGYNASPLDAFNIGLDEIYKDNGIGELTIKERDYGMFVVPPLMNVEHTAPYMHDGRFSTLEEVIEHYNSGIREHGNLSMFLRNLSAFPGQTEASVFAQLDKNKDNMLTGEEARDVPPVRLNLSADEKRHLLAFLKTFTDEGIFTDSRFGDPFVQQ